MREFVHGQEVNQSILDWMAEEIPMDRTDLKTIGFGVKKDGRFIAASALVNFNGQNVDIQLRVDKPYGLTRELIYRTFDFAFNKMGANRITSTIIGDNPRSFDLTMHFGFRVEAILEGYSPNGENLTISVLWKKDCRYHQRPF